MAAEMEQVTTAITPTRTRLIQVAIHLFASQGYEHTPVSTITREARTSDAHMIKLFTSKEGLLEAVFLEAVTQAKDAFDEVRHMREPRKRLQRFVAGTMVRLQENPDLARILVFELGRMRRKSTGELLLPAAMRELMTDLEYVFQEAKDAKQLRGAMPAYLVCVAFFGALRELLSSSLSRWDREPMSALNDFDRGTAHLLDCFFSPTTALQANDPAANA